MLAFSVLVLASFAKQAVHSLRYPPSAGHVWKNIRRPINHIHQQHLKTSLNSLPHQYQLENLESTLRHKILSADDTFNSTIFCNVELNCANLEAIGFDMDFTLAQVIYYSFMNHLQSLILTLKLHRLPDSIMKPLICLLSKEQNANLFKTLAIQKKLCHLNINQIVSVEV